MTRKKPNAPLIFSLIVLTLIVGGSAHDFRLQQAKHKSVRIQNRQPTPTTWPMRSVTTQGYQIALPNEFQLREDRQTNTVAFLNIVKLGVKQQSLIISRKKTVDTDPCIHKAQAYTHASCLDMFDTHVLDWGSFPTPHQQPEYLYTIIQSGYEYKLHFIGFPEPEKSKILATFRTT